MKWQLQAINLNQDWKFLSAQLTAVVMGCMLCVSLANTYQMFRPQARAPQLSALPVAQHVSQQSIHINELHLFGASPNANLPDTALALNLLGVSLASLPQDSTALIADVSGHTKIYSLGDKLPGGAMIDKILENKVVLDINGELESLSLPKMSKDDA